MISYPSKVRKGDGVCYVRNLRAKKNYICLLWSTVKYESPKDGVEVKGVELFEISLSGSFFGYLCGYWLYKHIA